MLQGGLNIINNTNLEYFNSEQKAELFRLKAMFLEKVGNRAKANNHFCQATMISPSYARTWESWGGHCNRMSAQESDGVKKKQLQAQALGCFLESIRLGWGKARMKLPLIIDLVRKDGELPGLLVKTLAEKGPLLPEWVWLPYISILLNGLGGIEAEACKKILSKIVEKYPQSVFWPLRAYYLKRRDAQAAQGGGTSSKDHAEELMTALRRSHPRLFATLELVVEELLSRFRPSLEEELLLAVTALSKRIDQLSTGEVTGPLKNAFKSIAERFFASPAPQKEKKKSKKGGSVVADGGEAEAKNRFNELYEGPFTDHFLVAKLPVSAARTRLKMWSDSLGRTVSRTPRKVALSEVSPRLAGMNFLPCDLWPSTDAPVDPGEASSSNRDTRALAQHAAQQAVAAHEDVKGGSSGSDDGLINIPDALAAPTQAPRMELAPKLLKFASTFEIVEREGELRRRVGMVGSDGKVHHFVVGFSTYDLISTQIGAASLTNYLGSVVSHDLQSRRRHLTLQAPALAPLSQRAMLRGEPAHLWRLSDVPDIGAFARRILASPEDVFCFRRTLARETAYALVMQRLFGRSEGEMYLDGNGALVSGGLALAFDDSGILREGGAEIPAAVKEFLGDLLVRGAVVPAMSTLAKALASSSEGGSIGAYVGMFLSAALFEYHAARSGNKTDEEARELRKTLSGRDESNVDGWKARLQALLVDEDDLLKSVRVNPVPNK